MREIRARVTAQEKGLYSLKSEAGEKNARISGKFRFQTATVSDYPAVGDYVTAEWPEDSSDAVIRSLFPRKSCFLRKAAGPGKQEQVVAANIDTVFLCMSLNNDYNIRRLERYLSVAWDSGAEPVIVLTKTDLCGDTAERIAEVQRTAAGVDVLAVSSLNRDYGEVYRYVLPGKTVAFLGSSGVGKSTLINRLIGADAIATGEIRNDDRGRHTTTRRELIELENGAFVIDTPGMRELGMWDNESGIDTVFDDIGELVCRCRFSDCSHRGEPGCAVLKALGDGTLERARWEAYLKLKIENDFAANGSQYMESRRAKFKEISKINKAKRKNGSAADHSVFRGNKES